MERAIDRIGAPSLRRGVAALVLAVGLCLPVRADAEESNGLPIDVAVAGLVEAPEPTVRAVLLDLDGFGRWFPATAEWRVIGRPRADEAIVYGRQALPWPVHDRDYVVVYRWWEADGAFHLRATAVRGADLPPPADVVRVERMQTEWRIEAAPAGTRVRYRYRGDTGGRLPAWAARAGWRAQTPRVIDGLREEVGRRAAPRPVVPDPSAVAPTLPPGPPPAPPASPPAMEDPR